MLLLKPTDIDYEIFVFDHYVRFMEFLLKIKERKSTIDEDIELLKDRSLHYTKRFALIYKVEKKKIVSSNLDLSKFILNILK